MNRRFNKRNMYENGDYPWRQNALKWMKLRGGDL